MQMIKSGQTRSTNGAWHSYADETAGREPDEREPWPVFTAFPRLGNFPPYPTLAEIARYTDPIPRPHVDSSRHTPEIIRAWEEDMEWSRRIAGHQRHDSQTTIATPCTVKD